ncbi:MAG TPA: adenosylcobinamide-phosphate synthase CbiB [Alphaproteobacteria bacterium]|nr:adenosylcobinamide-phosphate synthase CbiB [Alphaproteobacteria bacterium]
MTLLDPHSPAILLLALAIEAGAGYPDWVYRRVRHPVVWVGRLIEQLDRQLNPTGLDETSRRTLGAVSLAIVVLVTGVTTGAIAKFLVAFPVGWVMEAVLASSLLSQRSLFEHVAAVAEALENGGLAPARMAVAKIVGRNPEALDEAAVARAAIESLAENFSDGVVAPAFWLLVAGLPGIAIYKAINTADSMVGHRTSRYRAFGWAAARLDDLVNLPASRLSAFLLVLASLFIANAAAGDALRAALRDASGHRSPNAGWPEAAMAGALGLKLAGPRVYGAERVSDAWMGDGRAAAVAADVRAALALYRVACGLLWGITGLVFVVVSL